MIELRTTSAGVLLPIQGQAGARREGIVGVHNGRLKVAVSQVAEKGKANREILRVVAESLGLSRSQVQLHSGATVSRKTLVIRGVPAAEVLLRLQQAIPT